MFRVIDHEAASLSGITSPSILAELVAGVEGTEAEDIKKQWQEYTEELYKKYLHDPDNHNGVITHLEAHILDD